MIANDGGNYLSSLLVLPVADLHLPHQDLLVPLLPRRRGVLRIDLLSFFLLRRVLHRYLHLVGGGDTVTRAEGEGGVGESLFAAIVTPSPRRPPPPLASVAAVVVVVAVAVGGGGPARSSLLG